ncbi:MAG TPA: hypothetical protein VK943_10465 [Arenibaculum sp.]|nr:hypothetical protein [Arenibaculum sp.]
MQKTELLFVIMNFRSEWIVRSEDQQYGPFISYSDAFHDAVEEAQAAGLCGFASAVLGQSSIGSPFDVQWTYGRNAYPLSESHPRTPLNRFRWRNSIETEALSEG